MFLPVTPELIGAPPIPYVYVLTVKVERFGDFVDTGITRVKEDSEWPGWRNQLADNEVQCALTATGHV